MELLMLVLTWLSLQFAVKTEPPTLPPVLKTPEKAVATKSFDDEAFKVQFEIRLGIDNGGCRDRGICYIRVWFMRDYRYDIDPRTGYGEGSFENDRLTIFFDLSKMEPKTRDEFFGSDTFVVGADYTITEEVADALNIKGYTIPKGKYPITRVSKDMAQVVF